MSLYDVIPGAISDLRARSGINHSVVDFACHSADWIRSTGGRPVDSWRAGVLAIEGLVSAQTLKSRDDERLLFECDGLLRALDVLEKQQQPKSDVSDEDPLPF